MGLKGDQQQINIFNMTFKKKQKLQNALQDEETRQREVKETKNTIHVSKKKEYKPHHRVVQPMVKKDLFY